MSLYPTLALAAVLAAATDRSEGPPKPPDGPPPSPILAKLDRDGALTIRHVVLVPVLKEEEVTEKVRMGDKEVPVTRKVQKVSYQTKTVSFTARRYRALGADGKDLDRQALAKRLQGWTAALLSQDGKPLDPYYRAFFQRDLPVIVLPPQAPQPVPAEKKPLERSNKDG